MMGRLDRMATHATRVPVVAGRAPLILIGASADRAHSRAIEKTNLWLRHHSPISPCQRICSRDAAVFRPGPHRSRISNASSRPNRECYLLAASLENSLQLRADSANRNRDSGSR
jgi:hypothetical protein